MSERTLTLVHVSHHLTGPIVRVVAMAGAFALGVYVFSLAYAPGDGVAAHLGDYAFKSLQLIVGQFPDELADKPLPPVLQIARWALPLLTLWGTVGLAWVQMRNQVRGGVLRLRGEHLVLAGDGTLAGPVALAERKAHRGVMLWTNDLRQQWVQDAANAGAPNAKAAGPAQGAEKLGLAKARSVLLVGPDDAANISLATAALDTALKSRGPGEPLSIIARVDDPDLRGPLERRFEGAGDRSAARLRFTSTPDLAARLLFLQQPLDRFSRPGETGRRIVYIGFNAVGERHAQRVLVGGHFRDGVKPELLVLDPDAERKRQVFLARRPGAAELAPMTFQAAPVNEPALVGQALRDLIAAHGAPNLIVIDPADAARALPIALAAESALRERGIIAPPLALRANPEAADADSCGMVVPFGGAAALAHPEVLSQEELDTLARSIHDFYFEGRLAEGDAEGSRASMHPWDQLPEAFRDDNRFVADCYGLKLRDIGARIVPGAGESLQFDRDELESLARAEHDRWTASKVMDGWRHAERRDDAARLHPDIVPYDALSERIKDLDREQVRIITRLAGQSDKRAVRDLTVLIDAPDAGPSFAQGLVRALPEIAAKYPDRAVVVLGDFESAGSRAVLSAAGHAGAAVALTLAAPTGETLSRLSMADRAEAKRLLLRADRLYALPVADWPADRRETWLAAKADLRVTTGARPSNTPTVALDATGRIVGAPWGS